MPAKRILVGQTFGKLKVIAKGPDYIAPDGKAKSTSLCRCECGAVRTVGNRHLLSGASRSCGRCQIGKWNIKHGHAHAKHPTRTYRIWQNMLTRCENTANEAYPDYGGRGIKVCNRWHRFEAFLSDMGEVPEGLTLDRKDNNGSYEPSNCRWATRLQQMCNMRSNRVLTAFGKTACLSELVRAHFLNATQNDYFLVSLRLRRGWSIEEALTTERLR